MPATTKLSVIIPAYNKDKEVFQVVTNYVQELKHQNYDWEIIVVDDASKDKTLREAIRSKRFNGNTHRIKIYSYNLNQGKGFALYYGFKKSSGQTVVFADSDLDLASHNLTVLLKQFEDSTSDITIGSKRHKDSIVNYPLLRRFQSKIYQLLIKGLFNLNLTDTQVGLKAFRRQVLEESFPRIVVKRFAFDVELLMVAKSLGFTKISEAPIHLNYNFSSTINFEAIEKILWDTFAIFYRKHFLKYYDNPKYDLDNNKIVLFPLKTYA